MKIYRILLCISCLIIQPMAFATTAPLAAAPLQSELVLPILQGIRLLGNWNLVNRTVNQPIYTVMTEQVFLLEKHPGFLDTLQSTYVGKPLTQEAIWNLKCDLVDFYGSHGQPFAVISVPHQDLKHGILQVVVSEAKYGNITVRGDQHFPPSRIRNFIQAKPGDPIDGRQLLKDMARMNQNPFRRTDAIWRPGAKPGTADLELATVDRWPYRFYTGADNTGTVATDRDRFFFGLNLGKTIVEDSEISYQFTCSPNWNRFNAQTALFRIPFPARQTCIFYGGYSQVQPKLESHIHEKSQSWQVDGRYRIPLITNTSFLQELILGYDFKQVIARIKENNTLLFHGYADINQFMLGYDLGHRGRHHRVTFVVEAYGNPGGITTHNHEKDYQSFRPGSGPEYVYGKLSHSFAYRFCRHWWFSYDLNGQLSSKNLLPSEQFVLSGYNAVRGFEERIVSVDQALLINLSLQTPRMSIGKLAGWSRKAFDELYFLVFFDYGLGANREFGPHESSTVGLASIGPGIRYQIDRYVTARFDYGFQVMHYGFDNPSDSRYNFGLIVSF